MMVAWLMDDPVSARIMPKMRASVVETTMSAAAMASSDRQSPLPSAGVRGIARIRFPVNGMNCSL